MDRLKEEEFVAHLFLQRPKRQPYCFDQCFESFEKEVSSAQEQCIRISPIIVGSCVRKYETAVKILRQK